ncbi:MAG TPA: hypothetical protein VHC47_05665, partial [Mucilaginibacter sp.]|nr:hypothetical protein [Mucilaginibacter sp.]
AEHTGHIDFHLEEFEMLRNCHDMRLRDAFAIKTRGENCYMLFIDKHYIEKHLSPHSGATNTNQEYNYQVWGLAYVKKDFGRVLIRPETLADKLIELVHPVELDFEDDKAFSDTFYVLVNDRWKAEMAMDRNFRNVVMDMRHEDIVIEIIDHTLIIGYRKEVSPDTALQLADFVVRVCGNC